MTLWDSYMNVLESYAKIWESYIKTLETVTLLPKKSKSVESIERRC